MTGTELRRLRKRAGLSQSGLARELGVGTSAVARWEQGVRRISEPMSRLVRVVAGRPPRARRKGGR